MSVLRLLALSDIHTRFSAFPVDALPEADLCVIAGDLTDNGRSYVERAGAAQWITALAARVTVLYVAGNHDVGITNATFADIPGVTGIIDRTLLFHAVDKDGIASEQPPFTLHGVSLCVAYDMPRLVNVFDYTTDNPERERLAFDFPAVDVVVSHCPPFGLTDNAGLAWTPTRDPITGARQDTWEPRHIGSPCLRDYIERHRPRLVVCGHAHGQNPAVVGYEDTLVVNAAECATLITLPAEGTPSAEVVMRLS